MNPLLNQVGLAVIAALQLLVLYLLLKRSLQKRFSWFLTYILYELCETVLRFSVASHKSLYFKVYWLTAIGGAILSVLAIRESFLNVFWMYERLRWFTWTVWSCVALALMYSVFKAWVFPPIQAPFFLTPVVLGLEVAVDYSIGVVGILYFALILFFKIKDHRWESGIISGFTTVAIISVLGPLTRSVFGEKFSLLNQWPGTIGYLLAEIEWVYTLIRAEQKVPVPPRNFTIKDVTIFDQYIRILGRLLGRKS